MTSFPVVLNPQLQKKPLLWEQVSCAHLKLLHDVFTSLRWNTALKIPSTSQHVGSTDLLFAVVVDATEQASQAPQMQTVAVLWHARKTPFPPKAIIQNVCVHTCLCICICLTLAHSKSDVLIKIISIRPLEGTKGSKLSSLFTWWMCQHFMYWQFPLSFVWIFLPPC